MPQGDAFVLHPAVEVDGAALAPKWLDNLIEMRVERALQVPSRVTLRFTDHDLGLLGSGTFSLGATLKVSAASQAGADGAGELASVEVTGFSVDQEELDAHEFVVIGHDKSHRLGRSNAVSTFQDMTYSAIVQQVADTAGLQVEVKATQRKLTYMLQVESSLALITELANRIGYDWWVDAGTLYFKPPDTASSAVAIARTNLLKFSVRATGHRPDSVAVRGWDHTQQQAVEATANTATIAPDSNFAGMVDNPGSKFGTAKLLSANVAAASAEEATELSDALLLRAVAGAVTAKGVSYGDARIKPGVTVAIGGNGVLDGKYHVTAVDHVFRPNKGFQTRFTAGDRRPTTLVDTLANGNGHGNDQMLGNIGHSGLVIGTVTNVKDPDSKGKIRVTFTGLSQDDESAWARLVSIGGGQKRGMVFIPEVGDEVLVGFENDDIRQPVVFGGLFGAKLDIPTWDVADGKVVARRITSREGHYVELADGTEDTAKHIALVLKGAEPAQGDAAQGDAAEGAAPAKKDETKLRLGADRFDLTLPKGKPALIKIDQTEIEVTAAGDINMKAPNINIKGTAKVSIEAPNIDIKAQAQASLDGGGLADVKGKVIQVDASGTAVIKGNTGVMIN